MLLHVIFEYCTSKFQLSKQASRDARRNKKRQDRLCKDTEGSKAETLEKKNNKDVI